MSWENYNESEDLVDQVEHYRRQIGWYPESVHVDKLYRTRENLRYCNERGIRISGPRLGRPPKVVEKTQKMQSRLDELVRIAIEGKFGEGKRRYSIGRIMAKLPQTSGSVIGTVFLVMNLEKLLREAFLRLFIWISILGKRNNRNDHIGFVAP